MKFILQVRKTEECDLRPSTAFLPDDDEYEMYLNALLEDISLQDAVSIVKREASIFQIETFSLITPGNIGALISPMFTPGMRKNVRFVSLLETKE